jgi:hypothetical protein
VQLRRVLELSLQEHVAEAREQELLNELTRSMALIRTPHLRAIPARRDGVCYW